MVYQQAGAPLSGASTTIRTGEMPFEPLYCIPGDGGIALCQILQFVQVEVYATLWSPYGACYSSAVAGENQATVIFPTVFDPTPGTSSATATHQVRWDQRGVACFGPIPWDCNWGEAVNMGPYVAQVGPTDDQVTAMCANDPAYSVPPLQSIATTTPVAWLPSPTLLGAVTANPENEMESRRRCVAGQYVWRIEGDLKYDPFKIEVLNELPQTQGGMCPAFAPRLPEFFTNTEAHEGIHADVFRDVLNPQRNVLCTTYGTMNICNDAIDSAEQSLQSAHAATVASEALHPNHSNERRTILVCESPNLTLELWCGELGTGTPFFAPGTCQPYGNLYPGS